MSTLKRISGKNLSPIPDQQEWGVGFFCFPDTHEWRGVIRGQFARLGQGWTYKDCQYADVAAIGRLIEDTLQMDCKQVFEDIRDCVCLLSSGVRGDNVGGEFEYSETRCQKAKSVAALALYFVRQMQSDSTTVENTTAILEFITPVLPDGWPRALANNLAHGLRYLMEMDVNTVFGIQIPLFELRPKQDYLDLEETILTYAETWANFVYTECDVPTIAQNIADSVDSLPILDWKKSYLINMMSEKTIGQVLDGEYDRILSDSRLFNLLDFDCSGSACVEGCVLSNQILYGVDNDSLLVGNVWVTGVFGEFTSDPSSSPGGIYQPYYVWLEFENAVTVTINTVNSASPVDIMGTDFNCETFSIRTDVTSLDLPYTTPPLNGVRLSSLYPHYSFSAELRINV